jgi:hypothetical protein
VQASSEDMISIPQKNRNTRKKKIDIMIICLKSKRTTKLCHGIIHIGKKNSLFVYDDVMGMMKELDIF